MRIFWVVFLIWTVGCIVFETVCISTGHSLAVHIPCAVVQIVAFVIALTRILK